MRSTREYISASISVYESMLTSSVLADAIDRACDTCLACLRGGGKVLFAGNGGSAADAQHFAAELVSRFYFDRPGLSAVALTTDTSILTAIGNDYDYSRIFSRQLETLGQMGDVFFGISTSGRSPNILKALETAKLRGLKTIGLTGRDGGEMARLCDIELRIPSQETPLIQQGHLLIGHLLCGTIESAMYPEEASRAS